MKLLPTPIGLSICERVLIEEGTGNPSLISVFTGLALDEFPGTSPPFPVFASVTDGSGDGTISVQVEFLEEGESIYLQRGLLSMPSRLVVVNVHFRIRRLVFQKPGIYAVNLLIDQELIASRRLRVYATENQ